VIPHREVLQPCLAVGDWLQHEAFKSRPTVKRAEIVGFCEENTVMLYLDGEPGPQNVSRSEITRWWNYYLPVPRPDYDEDVPAWYEEGHEFDTLNGKYHAVIRYVKGAWLSYLETSDELGLVFRLKPFIEFKQIWTAVKKPSVWEWLRTPGV